MANPLVTDDLVDFLLEDVVGLDELLALPHFAEHSRETCGMFVGAARRVAREVLFPVYGAMDKAPPHLEGTEVHLHPAMRSAYGALVELGILSASRGPEVGGAQLPFTVAAAATTYLMAGNLSVYGVAALTSGAARLIESFGTDEQREVYMRRMYSGEWAGTMALTEPHAGSSLSDVRTRAEPAGDHYKISGTKVFISGGEHDLTENIVHLALARIDGAPPGTKGVSLFLIPKLRPEGSRWVPNDVTCTGVFDKVGWKAFPSVQLSYGEAGDCRGWLVGPPNQGLAQMFQLMNEARLMVGMNGVASASVAHHCSLEYARDRPQGRPLGAKDPRAPQVPIIEHADVRRMLLRQKAIVDGGLGLLLRTARAADLAEHAPDAAARREAHLLLELLIPIAKTFPAEYGFEANTLAIQIHGGYGYTKEYLPEAWWRDQKLNTIHEGTSGIQALDLLGRKVIADGGAAARLLHRTIVEADLGEDLTRAADLWLEVTQAVAARALTGDVEGMLRHASDYLQATSILVVAWTLGLHVQGAERAVAAGRRDARLLRGQRAASAYWRRTELVRVAEILGRVRSGEDSYAALDPADL
jgi:alkylation response protein AidB-like acyl-CoA dehydrogenase